MDKLANAIVGFNLINKYQPNTNQWKRIVELFNEEFDEDIATLDEEYALIEFLKQFINTNEIVDGTQWKQLISLSESVIKINKYYDMLEYDDIEYHNDIEENAQFYLAQEKSDQRYLSWQTQEEADDVVYRLVENAMDNKDINTILNKFVIASYMDSTSQLKLKF